MTSNRIISLPPIKDQGFSYGATGFNTTDGVHQESNGRLQELLFPQSLHGKRAQKAATEAARKTLTRKFIAAQLKHYGVRVDAKMRGDELRQVLANAVTQGLCDEVPVRLVNLRNRMCNDYDAANTAHEAAQMKVILDRFSKLKTPSEEADLDLDLFLKKYFLNSTGTPDPSKTPAPLSLPGFGDRSSLHAAAERIPGLVTVSGGRDEGRTIVIGWDRAKVFKEAGKVTIVQRRQYQTMQKSKQDKKMQQHRILTERVRATKADKPFSLDNAKGTYTVMCEDILDYSELSDELSLRITQASGGNWVGIFDFGVIEGIMRFSIDMNSLTSAESELESDEDNEDEDEDEDEETSSYQTNKRKLPPSSGQPPAKRKKCNTAQSYCVHLLWRGRETGESEIQLDYDDRNAGYLEFADATCTSFHGVTNFGFVGEKVKFEGMKIGEDGGFADRRWGDYSETAYERERVGRWH